MVEYDIVIIGGGPGGNVAAIRAAQLEARVALELLKDYELFEAKGHADTSVIVAAKEKHGYLASTDKEVRQRARAREIKLITLREGKYLIF